MKIHNLMTGIASLALASTTSMVLANEAKPANAPTATASLTVVEELGVPGGMIIEHGTPARKPSPHQQVGQEASNFLIPP